MKATTDQMVKAVKAYAIAHYEEDGWDSIVECYTDAELAEEISKSGKTTIEDAIQYIGEGCGVWDSYRKDIQAEGWDGW